MRASLKEGLAVLGVLVVSTAANAGDLYPRADIDQPIKWSGFIVAPYFGYETLNLKNAGVLDDAKGWRVGGEVDYDYQIGSFVVGVAGDAFYTWYDGNGTAAHGEMSARMFDYETVRGRLGYTFGRWMLFGTGGVAFGDMEVKNGLAADRKFLTGWTAGGGFEWVWNNNLTLRGELAHITFNQDTFSTMPGPNQDLGADLNLFKVDFITRF